MAPNNGGNAQSLMPKSRIVLSLHNEHIVVVFLRFRGVYHMAENFSELSKQTAATTNQELNLVDLTDKNANKAPVILVADSATDRILNSGLPVNAATRDAVQNTYIPTLHPALLRDEILRFTPPERPRSK
jgi:hypothetical protein